METRIVRRELPDYGVVYTPRGDGPFPTILLLHGSEGGWSGWSDCNAMFFAAHGFAALPFRYSMNANAWNAGDILDVPLDRTAEAMQHLRNAEFSDGTLGVFGVSRGGEHALLLASLMARDGVSPLPDAVAAHAPADVVCGAFRAASYRDGGDPGWQVWDPAERAWTWRGASDDLLPTTAIQIERYAGPVYLSHGMDDTVWSAAMTRRLEARLLAAGRCPEVHYYEGEGHGFSVPQENLNNERLVSFFTRHLVISPRPLRER